ncbi:unnamed protein product [Trichogramma brassicae]|uniref:Reverse transcriptase domain-containing protein n=1 Tax=Trichogramma brassicae TaxID=86971 RepID=A0A6H5ISW0_9HYME|nr:unnamed protein product [Trichogramma brassicae]CAB0040017.1 unnamed protein product [Trichogramma brassicae]
MCDGQQDQQAPKPADDVGKTSQLEGGSLPSMPTKTTTPSLVIVAAITRKIIGAPLIAKDAMLPTPAEFAIGSYEEKMICIVGLVDGLNKFIFGGNNLHKEWLFPRVPDVPAMPPPLQAGAIVPAVTLEELRRAYSWIKEYTAPGPDGVPNSAIKIAIDTHPYIFLQVYTACLRTGVFPVCWKRQRLVLLPKPGKPPEEPSSYRPLCMLDTAEKILERIIYDRLEATTESLGGLSDHQYGFRKGRSTINAIENVIAIAREAIASKRLNRGTKKYCAVVTLDVKNAFNLAQWNNIHAALRRMRMPKYLLRIIRSYLLARLLD